MLKKTIRETYLEQRLKLADDALLDYNARIIDKFNSFSLPQTDYLLSYYPLAAKNEFDVSQCEVIMKQQFPLVTIGWPRLADGLVMEAFQIQTDGLYAKNRYNILEPINGEWIPPELINVVFVPLVAFDKKGYRVGYGKGFYDRFLLRCKQNVLKIGFSFFEPLDEIRDIDEFDVPLNFCITPSRIYEF
ncbi:MAG: 5-formyltetrahydrofolate cyclo-ligase [Chitinophagaceae bacterium]|nr:5-formyltetrahydrofolate cyclo-ligase [Chitinophagaceae bacterium]